MANKACDGTSIANFGNGAEPVEITALVTSMASIALAELEG